MSDTTTFAPPALALLRLELVFTMDEPVELPPFRGNLWRGVLGPALKLIDDGMLPGLSTGSIQAGTLYRTFFETPPPPDAAKMRRYKAAPHPYVVDAPGAPTATRLDAGAQERVGLTLVGHAATAAEAVLAAFDFAARAGLGAGIHSVLGEKRERGRARLTSTHAVWHSDEPDAVVFDPSGAYRAPPIEAPKIPECPDWLSVILATPLRLTQEGQPVGPRQFAPGLLVSNLVRRVSMLSEFFGDHPLETDFRALKGLWEGLAAREVRMAFADQKRWSGQQKREVVIGGLVGSFALDMKGFEPLFPYLWLAQWINAGKGAVMGMGSIRLRAG